MAFDYRPTIADDPKAVERVEVELARLRVALLSSHGYELKAEDGADFSGRSVVRRVAIRMEFPEQRA